MSFANNIHIRICASEKLFATLWFLLTLDVSKVSALTVDVARALLFTGNVSKVSTFSGDMTRALFLTSELSKVSPPLQPPI